MADVIRKATNRFTKGLIMDFSPENTKNEVLTHALNATLLTFNGNELSLQNDMGNARVETAYLPDGYMPVGTCEYGGIIYIVSYNPLEDKSQIGCFPSPERNISSKELGRDKDTTIFRSNFQELIDGVPTGTIVHNTLYVLLKNDNLNPGDKFLVCANKSIYNERLADLLVNKDDKLDSSKNPNNFELVSHPIIALNIVSIEDSGKIVYLNSDVRHYDEINSYTKDGVTYNDTYRYHILGKMAENPSGGYDLASVDPDAYRNVLSSGYSVFKSKTSGKLAILAELIMVDSYSVTHSLVPKVDDYGSPVEGAFDIVIHTEVTPEVDAINYNTVPKLKYYYLSNSLGYIQISDSVEGNVNRPMFLVNTDGKITNKYNTDFTDTKLKEIYISTTENFIIPETTTIGKTGKFNFPKPYTYHGRMIPYEGDIFGTVLQQVYTKFIEGKYHRIDYSQVSGNLTYYTNEILAKFYEYNSSGLVHQKFTENEINESFTYYVREPDHLYHDIHRDTSYKTATLYKIVTSPLTAQKEQIEDTTLEKFQYQEKHNYRAATQKDKESGKKLYYKEGDDYKSLVGVPDPNKPYYVLEIEYSLVSIGTVVDLNKVTGEIYYYPDTKTYEEASQEDKDKYYDESTYPDAPPFPLYRREENWKYIAATEEQISSYLEYGTELYYSTDYILIPEIHLFGGGTIFMVVPMDTFVDATKFNPDQSINYIYGKDKPTGDYPKDDPIYLYTLADFIPENLTSENSDDLIENGKYKGVKLASITLPSMVYTNGLDLPFKYDYTIVPCMNYGRLDHLAVSNTIDFSKLHAFNLSTFSTWKYRIDNNQLRLTFGADVYDTYETYKVDGLVLEFYDCWGFAGSLEIVDKKSYSGIFTKIIPLNSLKALSRKKILANDYSEKYVRNINIKEKFNEETKVLEGYIYNNESVFYTNSTEGWSGIDEDNNDCGTLYSNILYGVKAYLRRTTKNGKEFLHKQDFFLFTLPIYNDYYYTVSDFSNLENPELNLMLTYKLKDSSTIIPYSLGEIINNGYNTNDNTNLQSYLGGFYLETSLDLIKYYLYKGTSDLFLEIGLKKDYESLNLNYNPEINSKFSCELRLIGDLVETEHFTVNSGIEGLTNPAEILNYNDLLEPTVNNLGFDDNAQTYKVFDSNFRNSNFINSSNVESGPIPIKINYNYVVGYKAKVDSIRSTQVQATTICALCHKQASGEYNYEDFGIYEQITTDTDGNEVRQLLSNAIFYNEGTETKEVFGLCRQMAVTKTMSNQLSSFTFVETDASEIKTAGKLNSGDPLKHLVGQLGKLTFCQPHAHGFSETNGVNIHEGSDGGTMYGIPPEVTEDISGQGHGNDDTYGTVPRDFLHKNPKYNLCANTINSIKYNSEFISAVDYNVITGKVYMATVNSAKPEPKWSNKTYTMKEYIGFTGEQVVSFNEKMLETMKYVYAYNPDYDSLTVNVGNIILQDYNPYFTSNLISQNSSLSIDETKGEFFNDYINLGPISITNYLKNLNKHSVESNLKDAIYVGEIKDDKFVSVNKQVKFIPNFDYCGTETNPYLITSLTYNTPVPQDLELELEFSASDMNVIKHSDGTNTYLKGIPNKKALYGYNKEFNKMVQLDVSNYTIQNDGTLILKNEGSKETKMGVQTCSVDDSNTLFNSLYNFKFNFSEEELLSMSLAFGKNKVLYLLKDSHGSYLSYEFDIMNDGIKFSLAPSMYVGTTNPDFKYTAKVNSVDLEIHPILLNDKVGYLYNLPAEMLYNLVNPSYYGLITLNGQSLQKDYYVACDNHSLTTEINGLYGESLIVSPNKGILNFNIVPTIGFDPTAYSKYVLLFVIKVNAVNFTVTKTSNLETDPNTFLSTTRTLKYSEKIGRRYLIKLDYENAQIKGTSITLNDLVYEPNLDGHRLFMRNNLWNYDSYLRGKLYYRLLDIGEGSKSWNYNNSKYLNNIFLFTGPCFTPDTLNT